MSSNRWPSTPAAPLLALQQAVGVLQNVVLDTPCRTAGRTDTRVLPSLWHVTPSAASESLLELSGSSPISGSSPLLAFALNRGPFPPPALPGFPGTTGLSVTPSRPASSLAGVRLVVTPRPPMGLPVLRGLPLACMPSPLPRRNPWVLTSLASPSNDSLPRIPGRVGFRITLFEACSAFTHVTACMLAKSPSSDPLHRRLQPLRYLHDCSDCYRLERQLPGGVRTH